VTVTVAVVGDVTLFSLLKVLILDVPSLTKFYGLTFHETVNFFGRCSFYN